MQVVAIFWGCISRDPHPLASAPRESPGPPGRQDAQDQGSPAPRAAKAPMGPRITRALRPPRPPRPRALSGPRGIPKTPPIPGFRDFVHRNEPSWRVSGPLRGSPRKPNVEKSRLHPKLPAKTSRAFRPSWLRFPVLLILPGYDFLYFSTPRPATISSALEPLWTPQTAPSRASRF